MTSAKASPRDHQRMVRIERGREPRARWSRMTDLPRPNKHERKRLYIERFPKCSSAASGWPMLRLERRADDTSRHSKRCPALFTEAFAKMEASANTIAGIRDTFSRLHASPARMPRPGPTRLRIEDLERDLVGDLLSTSQTSADTPRERHTRWLRSGPSSV